LNGHLNVAELESLEKLNKRLQSVLKSNEVPRELNTSEIQTVPDITSYQLVWIDETNAALFDFDDDMATVEISNSRGFYSNNMTTRNF